MRKQKTPAEDANTALNHLLHTDMTILTVGV